MPWKRNPLLPPANRWWIPAPPWEALFCLRQSLTLQTNPASRKVFHQLIVRNDAEEMKRGCSEQLKDGSSPGKYLLDDKVKWRQLGHFTHDSVPAKRKRRPCGRGTELDPVWPELNPINLCKVIGCKTRIHFRLNYRNLDTFVFHFLYPLGFFFLLLVADLSLLFSRGRSKSFHRKRLRLTDPHTPTCAYHHEFCRGYVIVQLFDV